MAFDPLQWREKHLSAAIASLPGADLDELLTTCSRQSSALAMGAVGMVAAIHDRSSWRVAPESVERERLVLKDLEATYLTDMEFVKPGGRIQTYRRPVLRTFKDEAEALRGRWDLWTTVPALLILEDRGHDVHHPKSVSKLLNGVKRTTASLQDVQSYRGLDFQAVWIFMSESFYDRIQDGRLGLGKQEWELLRDLHIPFTRAKDETLLFLSRQ